MKAYLIHKDPHIKATLVIESNSDEAFRYALNILPEFWTSVSWFNFLVYRFFKS